MPTVVLQPSAGIDTFLSQTGPSLNYGIHTEIHVGQSPGSGLYLGLISFDLSSIPSNAIISSAVLALTVVAQDSASATTVNIHRSQVQWYEGSKNGASPSAGENASVYDYRNANGSVVWGGDTSAWTFGNGDGDYNPTASDSESVNGIGSVVSFTVTTDVQNFIFGIQTNYGWWLRRPGVGGSNNRKIFASSDHATAASRPKLTVIYTLPEISGLAASVATATARLVGRVSMAGSGDGNSSLYAKFLQPGSTAGSSAAAATAEATLRAAGNLVPEGIHGTSNVAATGGLSASGNLATGHAAAGATVTGAIMSRQSIAGTTTAAATASASITMVGFLRGVSAAAAETSGTIWGKAVGKVPAQLCENTPLLYITDGSFLPNGQMDLLDLLQPRNGFLLKDWLPAVAPYKGGGYFSDSALGSGRRLSRRVFDNAIEVMTLTLKGDNHNNTIWFARELLRWQELAADYWTSDWSIRPVYLVARSPREEHVRYAIVHVMSISNFGNPYSQPFFSQRRPAMENLTLRIERDPWTDTQPGEFEPVPISSIRSYTIADWGAAA